MKVTLVDGDDWKGLFIDGKLVTENHSLKTTDILTAVGVKFEVVYPDLDWLGTVGSFPENLDEVKLEKPSKPVKTPKKQRG